ncbi:MAG: hypothetical protein ACK55Z_21040, partial [bacterium]
MRIAVHGCGFQSRRAPSLERCGRRIAICARAECESGEQVGNDFRIVVNAWSSIAAALERAKITGHAPAYLHIARSVVCRAVNAVPADGRVLPGLERGHRIDVGRDNKSLDHCAGLN